MRKENQENLKSRKPRKESSKLVGATRRSMRCRKRSPFHWATQVVTGDLDKSSLNGGTTGTG